MRIAILTTETAAHARVVAALAAAHEVSGVLVETTVPNAPFETAHPFEADRDAFEAKTWFGGKAPALKDLAPTAAFRSLSTPEAAAHLTSLRADLAFVLGTRCLKGPVLEVLGRRLVNLHGADPQDYRGLDPELWAVYHGDFAGLVVTAQYTEAEVNAGAVLEYEALALRRGMVLHELRHAQAEAFIIAAERAITALSGNAISMITPLQRKGRRYGFMPRVLKDVCVERFRRHTAGLA